MSPSSVFDEPAHVAAADTLTAELIRAPIIEISEDRYEGRLPGTTGDFLTQAYLSALLDKVGFMPASPGGDWIQHFDLTGISTIQPEAWVFDIGGTSLELIQSEEFILTSGLQDEIASISNTTHSMLNMPSISKEEISGLARTFSYYVKFPESRWNDIKLAEEFTPKGDAMHRKLSAEFDKKYRLRLHHTSQKLENKVNGGLTNDSTYFFELDRLMGDANFPTGNRNMSGMIVYRH